MPGVFGGYGKDGSALRSLEDGFREAWPSDALVESGSWIVGGHSHGDAAPVVWADDCIVAVDGEKRIYGALESVGPRSAGCGDVGLAGLRSRGGNVVFVDTGRDQLVLEADHTGAFPLYFAEHASGCLFSSLLRPLARAVRATPDPVGIGTFLHYGYLHGARTFFKGIRRLRPGEALEWAPEDSRAGARLRSRVWSPGSGSRPSSLDATANIAWDHLCTSLRSATNPADRWGLMMSGGWDSRSLLAAGLESNRDFVGISHGDLESRELKIARDLCRDAGIRPIQWSIDATMLEPRLLAEVFARAEISIFPYWYKSGQKLREVGTDCVVAGVYGEVMGGHYGPAMLKTGIAKIWTVGRGLLERRLEGRELGRSDLPRMADFLLGSGGVSRPRGLSRDVWGAMEDARGMFRSDILEYVTLLYERGVSTEERLVEAFLTEHRGAQYIHGQLRSSRAALDVAAPFADEEFLVFASRLPLGHKLHNRVNQSVLRQFSPELLERPLAATFVPASWPLVAQEASRLVRKVWETGRWRLHRSSGGRVTPPRLGWINFEDVVGSSALSRLVSDLESDLWNLDEVRELADKGQAGEWPASVHPLVHQLLRIHTVDSMVA